MKKLLKIPYYILILGVASIGLLLLSTLLPIPGNLRVKIVKSGSMEPTIKTGGIVFIKSAPLYQVGDIITFGQDTKTAIPTTHRIIEESVEKAGGSRVFTTKGDANDAADQKTVSVSEIRGKVIFSFPYAGYILDFAKKPIGFALLVGLPALIIIFEEILNIFKEIKRIRRRKSGDDAEYQLSQPISLESNRETRKLEIPDVYRDGNVLDLRDKFESKRRNSLSFRDSNYSDFVFKSILLLSLLSAPLFGITRVGNTISYYNQSEVSLGNVLQASNDFGREDLNTSLSTISDFVPSLSEIEGKVLGSEEIKGDSTDTVSEETPEEESEEKEKKEKPKDLEEDSEKKEESETKDKKVETQETAKEQKENDKVSSEAEADVIAQPESSPTSESVVE